VRKESLFHCSFALFFNIVFPLEAFYAAGGVYEFLLAGKEGVAGGANFHLDVLDGGTGLNDIPASAGNGSGLIFGVYLFFHIILS
jgi:hypothetical protein